MVYVLAAYTLTIGVLVLYGVLLQYRARIARTRLVAAHGGSAVEDPGFARGFNLGAALLAPFWALSHGLAAAGAALLAALIGFVALVAARPPSMQTATLALASLLIGGALFCGVIGNRVVAAAARAALHETKDLPATARETSSAGVAVELATRELSWAVAGTLLHTVVLPWACYFWLGPA